MTERKSPKLIYDPETGKRRRWREGDPEPRAKAGRPNLGLAREPGAPRVEGLPASQYVDKTGRKNPGAFTSEDAKRVRTVKPHLNKQLQAMCQEAGVEVCFSMILSMVVNDEVKWSERLKAAEAILAYGFGRPKQQVDIEMGVKSDPLNDAIKRKRRPQATAARSASAVLNRHGMRSSMSRLGCA